MWPIATDGVTWSVCNNHEQCKIGWTNQDAVWYMNLGETKELCIRWGSRSPHKRDTFEGDDIGIFPHAAKHHSQWPWQQEFPACCRRVFRLAGFRKSSVTLNFPIEKSPYDAASHQNSWTTCCYCQQSNTAGEQLQCRYMQRHIQTGEHDGSCQLDYHHYNWAINITYIHSNTYTHSTSSNTNCGPSYCMFGAMYFMQAWDVRIGTTHFHSRRLETKPGFLMYLSLFTDPHLFLLCYV